MACKVQYLIIIGSILIFIFAYLYHVPNNEGVSQMNRVRLLSASMKIIKFIGFITEAIGLAPMWIIQRNCAILLLKLKPVENNVDLKIEDTTIEGVPVRIYHPLSSIKNEKSLLPAVIYYHGGAFYRGSIETHHPITRALSLQTGFIVISVEYRLAPENPFPAGLDDCMKVTTYVLDTNNAKKIQIDPTRVAIAGDSAGGNFAAVIAMRFINRRISENQPRLQVLIYPVVQFFDLMLPSYQQSIIDVFDSGKNSLMVELYLNKSISNEIFFNKHTTIQQKKQCRSFVDWSLIPDKYRQIYKEPIADHIDEDTNLINNAKQLLDPDVSPLLVENELLAKLPPTYMLTVGHDRLRDEGFIYAARLKANGVAVVHQHFENIFHGSLTFLEGIFKLDIAHQMLKDISKYLKDHL